MNKWPNKKFGKTGKISSRFIFAASLVSCLLLLVSVPSALGQNFIGPTTGAGVGQGAIGVDSSNNLAVGTSTPQADTKLLIVGTSTTGGYFAIKVLDMNRGPLFIVRSDGSVSIGSPFVQSDQSGSTTTVSGVGTAPANGALFVNGPIFTTLDLKAGGIAVGTTTPQSGGSGYFTGTVTAGSFSGGLTGTVSASNISSGAFGSNTGEGNYSFPASISVSTTTAPTGGVAFFNGNVGIGTAGPTQRFQVNDTATAAFVVTSAGQVGIGTTAPIGTLDIANGITSATGDGGLVEIGGYINNSVLRIGEYQNYLLQTEVFNSVTWVKTLIGTVTGNSSNDPRGTALAENIPAGSDSTASLRQVVTDSATGDWTFSVWLKTQSGTATIQLRIDSSAETGTAKDVALTTVWKRFSVTQNFASANTTKTVYIVSGTNAISAWGAQLEPAATARRYSNSQTTTSVTTLTRTSDISSSLRILGALTGVTSGAFSSTLTNTRTALVITSTDGTILTNTTAATAGVPVQMSPRLRLSGTAWETTGGTSKTVSAITELLPITGADSSGAYVLSLDPGTGTYAEALRVLSNGNVGIGTTIPSSTLTVAGAIRTTSVGVIFPDNTTQATAYLGGTQTVVAGNVSSGAFGSNTGGGNYSFPASISVSTTTAPTGGVATFMGNVGIGTTGPSAFGKFAVRGAVAVTGITGNVSGHFSDAALNSLYISHESGFVGLQSDAGLKIWTGATEATAMTILTNGNVGIGTTGPGVKFHVVGSNEFVRFENPDSTTVNAYAQINLKAGTANSYIWTANNVSTAWGGANSLNIYAGTGGALALYANATEYMRILTSGNVGIGTTGPSSTLHVVGTAQFSQPVIVGTPTATSHAATKSYVDSTVGGTIGGTATNALACSGDAVCDMSGANLNSGNIVGVNKLTVTTIDPLYSINGKKYSTYAASFAGGVKEEYTGKAKLRSGDTRIATRNDAETYEYVIDFDKVKEGSDLWVWYKAIDFSKDSVEAIATPYGQATNIYYTIESGSRVKPGMTEGAKIVFHGDKPTEFSFRLTGKRFDWIKWPTLAPDQNEKPSLIVN